MRKFAYIAMAAWCAVASARAGDLLPGPVTVDVVGVHDGDSFTVMAHPWPEQFIRTHVRVAGVDTPEINGRCDKERALARRAKATTEKFLATGAPIVIRNVKLDKYGGRIDADVFNVKGDSLAAALLKARLAYPYSGGDKRSWCV